MGGASSHPEPPPPPAAINQSEEGGFHMIEVHTPSVGLGTFSVLLCVVVAAIVYLVYRRYCKRAGRWHGNSTVPHNSFPLQPQPMPSFAYGFPASPPAPFPFSYAPHVDPARPFNPFYPGCPMPYVSAMPAAAANLPRAVSHVPRIETLEESPRPARRPAPRAATPGRPPSSAAVPSSSSAALACDV